MQGNVFWTCSHCGTRNKAFSRVCLGCSREKSGVEDRARPAAEPFRMTRPVRFALAGALVLGLGLAAVLVHVFRAPALEAGLREPEPTRAASVAPHTVLPAPSPQPSLAPAPGLAPAGVDPSDRPPAFWAQRERPAPPERVVARPGDPTRDPRYVLMLREKRVGELRARLASARSREERDTLEEWLSGALRDLSEARREARF